MQQARKLRRGDKVAIVSLSSGMLGEEYCSHNIEIGVRRLRGVWSGACFYAECFEGCGVSERPPGGEGSGFEGSFSR